MQRSIRLRQGDGGTVEGIICTMEGTHLRDALRIWQPMLRALEEDDAFWDWIRKQRLSRQQIGYEAYAIEVDEVTQGLLWLETQQHRSQIDRGQRLVYIAALASAPWNRRRINPQPYLRGVGALLLQFARRRSLELGYNGRVGLHALPGSELFYGSQNMLELGADPDYDDMIYFEYVAIEQARWESRGYGV